MHLMYVKFLLTLVVKHVIRIVKNKVELACMLKTMKVVDVSLVLNIQDKPQRIMDAFKNGAIRFVDAVEEEVSVQEEEVQEEEVQLLLGLRAHRVRLLGLRALRKRLLGLRALR